MFDDDTLDAVLGEDDDDEALLLFMHLAPRRKEKQTSWKHPRKDWDNCIEGLLCRREFKTRCRMHCRAFIKLVEMLRPRLAADEKQSRRSTGGNLPLHPEVVVATGTLFLSGSLTADTAENLGVCKRSVGNSVDKLLAAVDECPDLKLSLPTNDELENCANEWDKLSQAQGIHHGNVGALDGWLCATDKPGDVNNPADCHSGHCQKCGLSVQAVCDANLSFTHFGVVAPGRTNDGRVFHRCQQLVSWLDRLPPECFIVGDNACSLNNNPLIPCSGAARREPCKRTCNFHLSQLRMRIEMAFGRLTSKWRIFRRQLSCSTPKNALIRMVAAALHNCIIKEDNLRFRNSHCMGDFEVEAIDSGPRFNRGHLPTLPLKPKRGRDSNIISGSRRDAMLSEIEARDMRRPEHNTDRNRLEELDAAPICERE